MLASNHGKKGRSPDDGHGMRQVAITHSMNEEEREEGVVPVDMPNGLP